MRNSVKYHVVVTNLTVTQTPNHNITFCLDLLSLLHLRILQLILWAVKRGPIYLNVVHSFILLKIRQQGP